MNKLLPSVPTYVRLPLRFDADRLSAELGQLDSEAWVAHFNAGEHSGGWSGVALIASDGDAKKLYPDDENGSARATPYLAALAYFREVLSQFLCPILSARLLKLLPGGRIYEHRDYGIGFEAGRIRLHIPIQTGERVRFVLGGRQVRMSPGETWYLDFEQLHHVDNDGETDRVHLVLDCVSNEWLSDLVMRAAAQNPVDPTLGVEHASPLDAFRLRVMQDPGLAVHLQRCVSLDQFVTVANELAQAQGFHLQSGELEAALRGAARGGHGLTMSEAPALSGWIPAHVSWRDGQPRVEWCWLGSRRLVEPFFEDSVARARREPFSRFLRPVTSLDALERGLTHRPGAPIAGIIAHVSRCGSTLVSRMLGGISSVVAISEPPPFDSVLREGPVDLDRAQRVRWLRVMTGALAQPREGGETAAILKLDSWHLPQLPLLREAFPGVPVVILYRDPVEVLVSHMKQPGIQMVPGMVGAPFDEVSMAGVDPVEFRARILGMLFEAAAREAGHATLVSYSDLPDAVVARLVPLFGLDLAPGDLRAVREVQGRDAKNPSLGFSPDHSRKQGEATEKLRHLAERWSGDAYRFLEDARLGKRPDSQRGIWTI